MRILINDYCGHPFQYDLSIELAKRGHRVIHSYTSASGGPKADFGKHTSLLRVIDVNIPAIKKSNLFTRWFQERKYGIALLKHLAKLEIDVVLSANTPLAAQYLISSWCIKRNIKFIFWLQDIISIAAESIISKKSPILGRIVGKIFNRIESSILLNANHIVTIADDFNKIIIRWGVESQNISTIPNWAPIDKIPLHKKQNDFSANYALHDKKVVLYSGTMGMKHNPDIIINAARELIDNPEIKFVILSDGIGFDYIQVHKNKYNLDNILLLGLQPFEIFPQVLASADILLTLLEPEAGVFSVPSKVWSGFCAARPSLLVMPKNNLAAKVTMDINAGRVVHNSGEIMISSILLQMFSDKVSLERQGYNARRYAEQNYKISTIASRFETVFSRIGYSIG
jgi:colanic acid biosynthesis glycosyl transferase WcaI